MLCKEITSFISLPVQQRPNYLTIILVYVNTNASFVVLSILSAQQTGTVNRLFPRYTDANDSCMVEISQFSMQAIWTWGFEVCSCSSNRRYLGTIASPPSVVNKRILLSTVNLNVNFRYF